jgi:Asp-tRNA(Asn)/Glu-tRNA(Gln) amidotransferase A subunit family amidase
VIILGNWNINIQGIGAHNNSPRLEISEDADKMFKKFVQELRDAGHTVEHATFTHGGKEDA